MRIEILSTVSMSFPVLTTLLLLAIACEEGVHAGLLDAEDNLTERGVVQAAIAHEHDSGGQQNQNREDAVRPKRESMFKDHAEGWRENRFRDSARLSCGVVVDVPWGEVTELSGALDILEDMEKERERRTSRETDLSGSLKTVGRSAKNLEGDGQSADGSRTANLQQGHERVGMKTVREQLEITRYSLAVSGDLAKLLQAMQACEHHVLLFKGCWSGRGAAVMGLVGETRSMLGGGVGVGMMVACTGDILQMKYASVQHSCAESV